MRIRTIKPDFFFHDGLFALERETSLPVRVAYIGLWCAADREGRFPWEPMRLGAQILPYDGVSFSRVMDALKSRGFIVEYASGSRVFGVIPSFKIHQIVNNKERESVIPEPDETLITTAINACSSREDRDDYACRKEGKGTEGKGTDMPPEDGEFDLGLDSGDSSPKSKDEALEIYEMYPRRVGRPEALQAIKKALKQTSKEVILEGLNAAIAMWKAEHTEKRFIPYPASWFNGQRWMDEDFATPVSVVSDDDREARRAEQARIDQQYREESERDEAKMLARIQWRQADPETRGMIPFASEEEILLYGGVIES